MSSALRTIGAILAVALIGGTVAREGTIATPEKFKISLEPEKTKFLIGELMLIHYRIDNLGETPIDVEFGGDHRATVRSTRFKIKSIDKDGTAVADPYPYAQQICRGGILNPAKVTAGTPLYQSLDLSDFAQIDKPGKYTIEVFHDLGWVHAPKALAEIEVAMPTAAEAEKIARDTLSMKDPPWEGNYARRKPYRELGALARPEYLPILKTLVQEGKGDALWVIEHIATPEATLALMELTEVKDAALSLEAAHSLTLRVPLPPEELAKKDFDELLHGIEPWRKMLARTTWRAEFAPAALKIAARLTQSAQGRELGEYILKCLGTKDGK